MHKTLLVLLALSTAKQSVAQYWSIPSVTVTSMNYVANRYAPVSQSVTAGTKSVVVMAAASFSFGLCPGDLIMIYQAQGASMNTTASSAYGDINHYNSAGLYEFKYVESYTGGVNGNTIVTQTAFTNSYASTGMTQIIKVAKAHTLTINPGGSIVCKPWKDTTIINGIDTVLYRLGGLVVIKADSLVNNGIISANGMGFWGGAVYHSNDVYSGVNAVKSVQGLNGGGKGESIFGYTQEYDSTGGRFCRGSPANGGGGGNGRNAGGGGGANAPNGNPWSGEGVMVVNSGNVLGAWSLSTAYIANGNALSNSSGGGHGGYSFANASANASTQGPGNPAWAGDFRREVGGIGGRPLTNIDPDSCIYFGGGGGGGASCVGNNSSHRGGNGGGIVFLITNTLTGTGTITSSGSPAEGISAGIITNNGGALSACNCVGGSGGGAGGSVIIKAFVVLSAPVFSACGGQGGDQLFEFAPLNPNENGGPGGGGGGGLVALSTGTFVPQLNGGLNGNSLSVALAGVMTSNGATKGASGKTSTVSLAMVQALPLPPPPYYLGSNSPLCEGATLTLTTNFPGPYFWTGPNSFTSSVQNPTIANVTATNAGAYYTEIGTVCGGGIDVYVNPIPPVSILNLTGTSTITCLTPSVHLIAQTTYTNPERLIYIWTNSVGVLANTKTITLTNASPGITLTAIDYSTGCKSSATIAIQLNTIVPVTSVSPINQLINCGPGVVASATGVAVNPASNVMHTWYFPCNPLPQITMGQISIANLGICTNVNGLSNGTNTFVVTDLINGCSTTKTVQVVSVSGFPSFSITSIANFTLGCATRSVADIVIALANTSPGGGVVSYTMLPPTFTGNNYGTNTSVNVYTVNVPGTYTMIVKDNGNQCETRIPLPILQNLFGPNIVATAPTRTLDCFTPSLTLHGISTTSNVSYSWKKSTLPPIVIDTNIIVNITAAGASVPSATLVDNFTLTIVDDSQYGNHCPSTTVVTIYQNTRPPKPAIALSYSGLTCTIYSVNATNISTSGILPGTFFAPGGVNAILWQGPPPQQDLANSSTYLGFVPGIYSMVVKDLNNGCTSMTTAVLGDEMHYPVIITDSLIVLDCGTAGMGVKLPASVLNQSPSAVTVKWEVPFPSPNISNPNTLTLTTDGTGEYTLTVISNTNGCGSIAKVMVVPGLLNADFNAEPLIGYAPLNVNFTNNSASSSTVSGTASITSVWSFGNGTTKTTTLNTNNAGVSTVFEQPGTYTVVLFTAKGECFDSTLKIIRVDMPSNVEIPNVFTPNGDNINDIFFMRTANLAEINATIFDRWGNKIYELTSGEGNIAWDGKSNTGKDAPDGTYFYIVSATGKDGKTHEIKGTVSLLR